MFSLLKVNLFELNLVNQSSYQTPSSESQGNTLGKIPIGDDCEFFIYGSPEILNTITTTGTHIQIN
ncbi:hypothetical protein ACFSKL_07975 [Belliella marina]|uniref:Uncharacterized protein n=1 Tax=Belliella marina TaxID=1644146 RepID=A0ABW4VM08_9BACT